MNSINIIGIMLNKVGGCIMNKKENTPAFPAIYNQIEKRRERHSESSYINDRTAANRFFIYAGRNITMGDITPRLIEGFERWLYDRVKISTARTYLRSLRAILNDMQLEVKELFRNVRTSRITTRKRAISVDNVERIYRTETTKGTFDHLARVLFLFSIMAFGIPFVDLAFLKWSDIRDGFISYRRRKTKIQVCVPVTEKIQGIIDDYGCKEGPYVFPLLRSVIPSQADREYKNLLPRYNRALDRIRKAAGISEKITSYTARHTWATTAFNMGEELAFVSKTLGHANPMTTLNYLKEIDKGEIEEASRRVIGKIFAFI